VHFAGQPCDMKEIFRLKEKFGFSVIEDSCHALGGEYLDTKIGSCTFCDLSVFSFHPVKHITTGEGGAVVGNDERFYEKLLMFRNHGMHKKSEMFINRELAFDMDGEQNTWYYEMAEVGHNYRITDIQCALGVSQIEKIDQFVHRRRSIAEMYNEGFTDNYLIRTPYEKNGVKSAYHLYVLQIDFESLGKSRNQVMQELRDVGIGSQVLYIPVHLQPYYSDKYGYKLGDFPEAEDYYFHCLSIPMFPGLTDQEVAYVIEHVNRIVSDR